MYVLQYQYYEPQRNSFKIQGGNHSSLGNVELLDIISKAKINQSIFYEIFLMYW